MVVDDDLIALEVLRERLSQAGHEVSVRSSPVGTAADMLAQRIEIVVLDLMMPGLRGDDLARMLKRHPATSNVGIVLHSSLSAEQLRPLIMTTGALGVIEKTSNEQAFQFAFNCLVARFAARAGRSDERRSALSQAVEPPRSEQSATSSYDMPIGRSKADLAPPSSARLGEQDAVPSGTYRVGQRGLPESELMLDAPPRAGLPKRR